MTAYQVTHRTTYRYGSDMSSAHLLVGLSPRSLATQQVRDHQLFCTPEPTHRELYQKLGIGSEIIPPRKTWTRVEEGSK